MSQPLVCDSLVELNLVQLLRHHYHKHHYHRHQQRHHQLIRFIVTFPIMENTVWAFVVVALGACFIGRLHIPIGSGLTNCCRGPAAQSSG